METVNRPPAASPRPALEAEFIGSSAPCCSLSFFAHFHSLVFLCVASYSSYFRFRVLFVLFFAKEFVFFAFLSFLCYSLLLYLYSLRISFFLLFTSFSMYFNLFVFFSFIHSLLFSFHFTYSSLHIFFFFRINILNHYM